MSLVTLGKTKEEAHEEQIRAKAEDELKERLAQIATQRPSDLDDFLQKGQIRQRLTAKEQEALAQARVAQEQVTKLSPLGTAVQAVETAFGKQQEQIKNLTAQVKGITKERDELTRFFRRLVAEVPPGGAVGDIQRVVQYIETQRERERYLVETCQAAQRRASEAEIALEESKDACTCGAVEHAKDGAAKLFKRLEGAAARDTLTPEQEQPSDYTQRMQNLNVGSTGMVGYTGYTGYVGPGSSPPVIATGGIGGNGYIDLNQLRAG